MLKELEKQLVGNVAREKDRLQREIEALRKKIAQEKKLHAQELTKSKQDFEEYKNAEQKEIDRGNKELQVSLKELDDVQVNRQRLVAEKAIVADREKAISAKEVSLEEAKRNYNELAVKAKKKEELFENKLKQIK